MTVDQTEKKKNKNWSKSVQDQDRTVTWLTLDINTEDWVGTRVIEVRQRVDRTKGAGAYERIDIDQQRKPDR